LRQFTKAAGRIPWIELKNPEGARMPASIEGDSKSVLPAEPRWWDRPPVSPPTDKKDADGRASVPLYDGVGDTLDA
jgi:hypothetical protein